MEENNLNGNDWKLLYLCGKTPKTVGELARELNIANSSIITRLEKLKKLKLISVEKLGKGKKTYITTKLKINPSKYIAQVLNYLEEKGSVSLNEYLNILPYDFKDLEGTDFYNKSAAIWGAISEGYVQDKLGLTEKGKQFLEKERNHGNKYNS